MGTHLQGPTTRRPCYVRQSHLVLGALPSAIPCARLHARLVLAEWDLKPLAETAELIVSELVTNAVRASGGLAERRHGLPTVRLWLSGDQERVLIEVWDADERMPVCERPDPDAEHGRGLFLVEALSDDWGTYRPAGYPGKIVWARCGADYGDAESNRAFLNIDE
jgi:anti-sigma regulatory factor (Ser/Thr protein kinase)